MLRWALHAAVDASDLADSIRAVELMQLAARLIAESGALPHRCDRAAALFRQMIAEAAAGAPFVVTQVMLEAHDAEVARMATRSRRVAA
jgi:hypothetical protein